MKKIIIGLLLAVTTVAGWAQFRSLARLGYKIEAIAAPKEAE